MGAFWDEEEEELAKFPDPAHMQCFGLALQHGGSTCDELPLVVIALRMAGMRRLIAGCPCHYAYVWWATALPGRRTWRYRATIAVWNGAQWIPPNDEVLEVMIQEQLRAGTAQLPVCEHGCRSYLERAFGPPADRPDPAAADVVARRRAARLEREALSEALSEDVFRHQARLIAYDVLTASEQRRRQERAAGDGPLAGMTRAYFRRERMHDIADGMWVSARVAWFVVILAMSVVAGTTPTRVHGWSGECAGQPIPSSTFVLWAATVLIGLVGLAFAWRRTPRDPLLVRMGVVGVAASLVMPGAYLAYGLVRWC